MFTKINFPPDCQSRASTSVQAKNRRFFHARNSHKFPRPSCLVEFFTRLPLYCPSKRLLPSLFTHVVLHYPPGLKYERARRERERERETSVPIITPAYFVKRFT